MVCIVPPYFLMKLHMSWSHVMVPGQLGQQVLPKIVEQKSPSRPSFLVIGDVHLPEGNLKGRRVQNPRPWEISWSSRQCTDSFHHFIISREYFNTVNNNCPRGIHPLGYFGLRKMIQNQELLGFDILHLGWIHDERMAIHCIE